jgi:hypothetical protein
MEWIGAYVCGIQRDGDRPLIATVKHAEDYGGSALSRRIDSETPMIFGEVR